MPGKILGLDIREDSISAVQVISGIKGFQVIAGAHGPIHEEGGLDQALTSISEEMELKSDTIIVSIPGGHVSFRNIQMPFPDPKKIKQTLPFEMETIIPFPIDDVIMDFNIAERSGQSQVLVASLKKDHISDYVEKLRTHGIDPDILDIQGIPTAGWLLEQEDIPNTGIFIEIGSKRDIMILFLRKRMVLIRSFMSNGRVSPSNPMDINPAEGDRIASDSKEIALKSLCKVIQNTVHAFSWQYHMTLHPEKIFFSEIGTTDIDIAEHLNRFLGIPAERISIRGDRRVRIDDHLSRIWDPAFMDRALALTLRDNRKGRGFNFRKGEFEVTKRYTGLKKEIRKIGTMLSLVLLFIIIDLTVDYQLLKRQYEAADQQVLQLYRQAFPDEKNIIRPLDQIKIKVNQISNPAVSFPGIETNQKIVDLLNDISNRLPTSFDLLITNMIIDQTTIRMSGETDSFNTVDSIKNNLEPSGYFSNIVISSAKLDRSGKRVQFEIKLERTTK